MPAKSKTQQRLMGMVHAYNKGELDNPPDIVKEIAKSMKKKDTKDFAETKHKGLPEKVRKKKKRKKKGSKRKIKANLLTLVNGLSSIGEGRGALLVYQLFKECKIDD